MSDPSLTPEQEQAVRRALQEVRPTGPPPDDVVARLDATLADLTADRQAADRPAAAPSDAPPAAPVMAPVVPLATRRRRWAGAGLVAAAAVVLIGVGIGPMVEGWQGGAGDDSAATSLDSGDDAGGAAEESGPADGEDLSDGLYSDQDRPMSGLPGAAIVGVPKVRPAHFERDVAAARDLPVELLGTPAEGADPQSEAPPGDKSRSQSGDTAFLGLPRDCGPTASPDERTVVVTYQRQPAVLLFRAPADGSQVVELHLCRDVGPERVTTLPAP